MIADAIRFILSNVPLILFVAALIIAATTRRPAAAAERYLAWILLLPVGVASIWAGISHVFFPSVASAAIGWQPSPFEFEIGVADLAAGIVAVLSFWRDASFKRAIALYTILFFAGVIAGHVRQAIVAHDFAADNFGMLLVVTVAQLVLLIVLLVATRRSA